VGRRFESLQAYQLFKSLLACSLSGTMTYTMTSGTGSCYEIATEAATVDYASAKVIQRTRASKIALTVTFTGAPVNRPDDLPHAAGADIAFYVGACRCLRAKHLGVRVLPERPQEERWMRHSQEGGRRFTL
jgi:hypothetical protein